MFDLKVTGNLVQSLGPKALNWDPSNSQCNPSSHWTILLVVNVYGELDYSPLVFNVCSSFLGWFVMFQKLAFLVFFFFFWLLLPAWLIFKWFYFPILVCLFSIHKVKAFPAKMKVSALVTKDKDSLSLRSYLIFGQFWAKTLRAQPSFTRKQ